jgi:formylglycine-generating enzyme required for sulfatase activity
MVIIRGGEFSFGTQLGYPEEQPVHLIKIADFWMDKTEVTVAQFADFVKSTGYISEAHRDGGGVVFRVPSSDELNTRPYAWWQFKKGANWQHPTGENTQAIANHPVTLITFNDALAYAKWLGRDLPTETEWEYAAKAGETRPALLEKQPRNTQGTPQANFWQGHFPAENTHEDGYIGLAPVGCFEANSFHLYDMIGNVWEQTKDIYTPSHEADQVTTDLSADRIKPDQLMVIKGGSHLCGQDFCVRYRASAREGHEANLPISHIGFRTVARNE